MNADFQRLIAAVESDNLELAASILSGQPQLANFSVSYGDERRPIHFAVMRRSPNMVRLLLQYGADPHAGVHPHRDATSASTMAHERGYGEITAIINEAAHPPEPAAAEPAAPEPHDSDAERAVTEGDLDWLRQRHAAGQLTNPIRWSSGGLLTLAVRHNQPRILEALLDFAFDPNERVSYKHGAGQSHSQAYPLWHAAALGHRDLAEILLRHGADPNAHVDSSGSPVYSAFSHHQPEMVDLLCAHGGIVTADIAAIYRQTERALEILRHDPTKAQELLHYAADGGDPEIVRMALEHIDRPRDDVRWFRMLTNPLSFWNHIPWLYAANKQFDRTTYFTCFRLILERCDANVVAGFGRTALHEVAAMGDHITEAEAAPFARALIEAGARTDVRDDLLQSTPLGWACRWGRASVAEAILESGAFVQEPGAEPWAQPQAWAAKRARTELLTLLSRFS